MGKVVESMEQVHQCKSMQSAEAWIEKNHDEWMLSINRVATEQDLEENHCLEFIGQTIENIMINVIFCPYCGEKMGQPLEDFTPSFHYNDFSKW
jgi:hypothetical protein